MLHSIAVHGAIRQRKADYRNESSARPYSAPLFTYLHEFGEACPERLMINIYSLYIPILFDNVLTIG